MKDRPKQHRFKTDSNYIIPFYIKRGYTPLIKIRKMITLSLTKHNSVNANIKLKFRKE